MFQPLANWSVRRTGPFRTAVVEELMATNRLRARTRDGKRSAAVRDIVCPAFTDDKRHVRLQASAVVAQ